MNDAAVVRRVNAGPKSLPSFGRNMEFIVPRDFDAFPSRMELKLTFKAPAPVGHIAESLKRAGTVRLVSSSKAIGDDVLSSVVLGQQLALACASGRWASQEPVARRNEKKKTDSLYFPVDFGLPIALRRARRTEFRVCAGLPKPPTLGMRPRDLATLALCSRDASPLAMLDRYVMGRILLMAGVPRDHGIERAKIVVEALEHPPSRAEEEGEDSVPVLLLRDPPMRYADSAFVWFGGRCVGFYIQAERRGAVRSVCVTTDHDGAVVSKHSARDMEHAAWKRQGMEPPPDGRWLLFKVEETAGAHWKKPSRVGGGGMKLTVKAEGVYELYPIEYNEASCGEDGVYRLKHSRL